MKIISRIRSTYLLIAHTIIFIFSTLALTPEARKKGFVYLHEIDPTILGCVRYGTTENFIGTCVDGYKKPVIIMTRNAAEALKKVQADVVNDGYSLVIYDAYRPQRAVNHFMRWADEPKDQLKKIQYYPRVNKADVFTLGYVAKRSGHSRGSTVDLTLIKKDAQLHEVIERTRTLLDGFPITFLDDGTVDMGSSFDLFDEASHFENNLIISECKKLRLYLREKMEKYGFLAYDDEWWHFTLKDEPYESHLETSYFDFEIE